MAMPREYAKDSPYSLYLENWIPAQQDINVLMESEPEPEPEVPTVTFSDDFNRANTSDLGIGWVEVSGNWLIISDQLSSGGDGGTVLLRAAIEMVSDDHYAQVTIAVPAEASMGVWCRGNSNITSGYLWRNDGTTWDLFRVLGGSFTVIGTYAASAEPGDVAKVQAVGSTVKAFVNGVERVSVTDTDVPTGTTVGIRSESTAVIRYDDFTGTEVTP